MRNTVTQAFSVLLSLIECVLANRCVLQSRSVSMDMQEYSYWACVAALGCSKIVVSTFPSWDEQRLFKAGTFASIGCIYCHDPAITLYPMPAGGKRTKR